MRKQATLRFLRLPDSPIEREAAAHYLQLVEEQGLHAASLLALVPAGHSLPELARVRGHQVDACHDFSDFDQCAALGRSYDGVVIVSRLEQSAEPLELLERVRATLKPGGVLLLVTPSLDSWSARLLGEHWSEWRRENKYYFDLQTVHGALLRAGFAQVRVRSDQRCFSVQHLRDRAHALPNTPLIHLVKLASRLMPGVLRLRMRLRLPSSAMVVTAHRVERRQEPLLSIVMPVYNERESFAITMDAVLRKQVPGLVKEIIVVESASTDGTREIVRQYEGLPNVRVVFQDRPRGKGNAVREGLRHARGDFILIQDADQEYDVNDYDALLLPLQRYRRAFVLGSRHVDGWKIREFNDQPGLVELLNVGHLLFVGLLNTMYRQKLKDPFTMYKVFRRDCLYGVHLECNRFDFDFELVIKLFRKGYEPLEVPVSYRSRSFRDGKKVSFARDPWTWLRALVKYRFGSIYEPSSPCSSRVDSATITTGVASPRLRPVPLPATRLLERYGLPASRRAGR
ncbi:MAG: glycosyltransferase [Chloroflexi bacterium]|nr:glycosyltransferase [Chloroflexota bacterium]